MEYGQRFYTANYGAYAGRKTTTDTASTRVALDEGMIARLAALLRKNNHPTMSGQSASSHQLGNKLEQGLVASDLSLLLQEDASLLFLARRLAELRLRMTGRNNTHDDVCRIFEDEAHHLLAMTRRKGIHSSWKSPKSSSLVIRAATLEPIEEQDSGFIARSETPLELENSYCQLGDYKPGTLHVTNVTII